MTTSATVERRPLATRVALIRILFGLIWAVDAWLKWQSGFIADFKSIAGEGAQDQAGYLKPWFDLRRRLRRQSQSA
jgi:nitrite reductase (NO-forming)